MGKAYTVEGDIIIINRGLTELDLFLKQFLDILKKYSDYLIVSGFVSIATGRTRGTEDIDLLVPLMDEVTFTKFFAELQNEGFWCYQGDEADDIYRYIQDKLNIRFAKAGELYPNIEFVPIDEGKKTKYFEFTHPQKMKVLDFEFKVPPLEFEILYKERVLGSKKDKADARHLRTLFSDLIKEEKFKEYEPIIELELR